MEVTKTVERTEVRRYLVDLIGRGEDIVGEEDIYICADFGHLDPHDAAVESVIEDMEADNAGEWPDCVEVCIETGRRDEVKMSPSMDPDVGWYETPVEVVEFARFIVSRVL